VRIYRGRRRATILWWYVAISLVFWILVLVPADGGSRNLHVNWQGALINLALIVPLWRGKAWARVALGIEALFLTLFIASEGVPPFGSTFGLFAVGPLGQFLLLLLLERLDQDEPRRVGAE
jgi:hypothetical protein